ncbi:ras-related protein O-Krev-like [Lineus longissimus]|uniref:ras-related protein O-Krev-like n=1 Tax=Lineus longissimus TaxID=88925 RepID=UPI00315CE3D1
MEPQGDEQRYRLVVLGSGGTGKSSIILRFLHGTFSDKYKQTVEDLYCRQYDYNGMMIKVDILDTAGDFSFPAMRRLSISTASAFVLVFSMDSMVSFNEVQQLREQIKEQRTAYQDIPCIIVANKTDVDENHREVSSDDILDWLDREDLQDNFVEASAKYDDGIIEAFQNLWEQAKMNLLPEIKPPVSRKRRVSAFAILGQLPGTEKFKQDDNSRLSRSKSLMRRGSKSKVKPGCEEMERLDCVIS